MLYTIVGISKDKLIEVVPVPVVCKTCLSLYTKLSY